MADEPKKEDKKPAVEISTTPVRRARIVFNEASGRGLRWECLAPDDVEVSSKIIMEEVNGVCQREFSLSSTKKGEYELMFQNKRSGQEEPESQILVRLNIHPK